MSATFEWRAIKNESPLMFSKPSNSDDTRKTPSGLGPRGRGPSRSTSLDGIPEWEGRRPRRPTSPAPAWPWEGRMLVAAAGITLLVFSVLPLVNYFGRPDPDRLVLLRDVETVAPPPPVPLETMEPEPRPEPERVRPDLPAPARPAPPIDAHPRMELAMPALHGDFGVSLDFGIAAAGDGVFDIADIDQPPRPVVQPPPMYPPAARQAGLEGRVDVEFIVLADGTVTDVQVLESRPGAMFVSSAVSAVRQWRFEPARLRGEPVPVRVRVPLEFRLER